jgi:DNA-binding MarR family transcriptional regulator
VALDAKTLSRLTAYLMQVDPDMPISRLRVFLFVAQRSDTLVRDLTKVTGMNQSTVARTLAILGDKPQRGGLDGLGWIIMTPDPDDPRRVLINVTPKGKRVLAEIEELGD